MMLAQDQQLGYFDGMDLGYGTDLGFIKKIARGVKKAAGAAASAAKAAATLPMKIAITAAIKAAGGVCALPQNVRAIGATAAGVNVNVISLFCQARQTKNMAQVRKLLPSIMKIAIKLGAQGMFPGLGPIMTAARFIPGLKNFAGADLGLMGPADIDMLGEAFLGELEDALDGASDSDILGAINDADAGTLGAASERTGQYVGLGIGLLALGLGTWLALRD